MLNNPARSKYPGLNDGHHHAKAMLPAHGEPEGISVQVIMSFDNVAVMVLFLGAQIGHGVEAAGADVRQRPGQHAVLLMPL